MSRFAQSRAGQMAHPCRAKLSMRRVRVFPNLIAAAGPVRTGAWLPCTAHIALQHEIH